ncbi:MAG: UDP-N-acetylmuramoyl-L-alanine--D-glutamate ligase [Halarsenatibacteraceae bacterium]
MNLDNMENLKVAIIGSGGVTGKALINFLLDKVNKIILFDDIEWSKLPDILKIQRANSKIISLGENKSEINQADLVVVSPGVPEDNILIQEAIRNQIPIISEVELAANKIKSNKIIAITGTNGKTTTTSILGEILRKGLDQEVVVAGNIGRPLISIVEKSNKDDVIVVELSSFQLRFIKDFRPKFAAFINYSPDHLDWHISEDSYFNSKANIFKNQTSEDYAILNYNNKEISNLSDRIKSKIFYVSNNKDIDQGIYYNNEIISYKDDAEKNILISRDRVGLKGDHNLENIAFASLISYQLGVSSDIIRDVVYNYQPEAHRLELVLEKDNFEVYDDSKATNPHATMAALDAFKKPLILIMGGQDRNLNYDLLINQIIEKCYFTILIGEISEKIASKFKAKNYKSFIIAGDLEETVELTKDLILKNDFNEKLTILLSPAAPSWDMFASYKIRGQKFKGYVEDKLN